MAGERDSEPGGADRPRPDGADIRKMTAPEVEPVAASLARAFYDDPHFAWIIRGDSVRLRRLERGFAVFMRGIWLPRRESYTQEKLIGGAMWLPPGAWHLGALAQLRMAPATIAAIRGDSPRLLRALTYIERHHPREPEHWYLAMIGVAPAWQGRGYGAALLRPVLERCDRDGTPAYLEASTARNRALYERHGFEVMDERRYAADSPPLWRMWREPRARSS